MTKTVRVCSIGGDCQCSTGLRRAENGTALPSSSRRCDAAMKIVPMMKYMVLEARMVLMVLKAAKGVVVHVRRLKHAQQQPIIVDCVAVGHGDV